VSRVPAGRVRILPRRRRTKATAAAAVTMPPMAAAKATPGTGAAGAGLPFPHVASRQPTGPGTEASAIWTTWVTEVSAPDNTACGTKPPMTTAATIAARPIRHRVDMPCRLWVADKRAIRKRGGPGAGAHEVAGARVAQEGT
jgi:hypothetical protein